jgi:predicted small lipoprotein YifL
MVRVCAVTLLAALALAGCGRKGGLDLPPAASVAAPAPAAGPAGQSGRQLGPDGRPLPAPPPPRHTPLDWLID